MKGCERPSDRRNRMADVHALKAQGLNNVQIGEQLGLSRHAVRRRLAGSVSTQDAQVKWGHGAAKLVKPATREATELVVFGSDFHFPYQDQPAVDSFVGMVKALGPHRVVLNGDIGDFFQLSRFNTAGIREDELQNEIDEANEFRAQVRAAAPDAVLDETCGNHDDRIITYVANKAGSLKTLRALQPKALFQYDELNINWHPGAGFLLRPNFLTKHGTMVRGEAGASAKAEFMAAGISGISGHTHRLATYRREGYTQRQWTEQACLCRVDPDYVVGRPNWTQGCAVGEFSTRSDSFAIHEVAFVDGKLRLGREAF